MAACTVTILLSILVIGQNPTPYRSSEGVGVVVLETSIPAGSEEAANLYAR